MAKIEHWRYNRIKVKWSIFIEGDYREQYRRFD